MLWDLSVSDLATVFLIFAALSYICGWICDVLLANFGFGPLGNAIVILMGAFAGMFGYNMHGNYLFNNPEQTYFVIGFAAFSMMVIMATVKRVVFH